MSTIDVVEVYRDDAGEWRWRRLAAGNNEIIATSGEGYKHSYHAVEMAYRVNPGHDIRVVLPS